MTPASICEELQHSIHIMLLQRPPMTTTGWPMEAEAAAEAAVWATTYQVAGDLCEEGEDEEDSHSNEERWWADNMPSPTASEEEEMATAEQRLHFSGIPLQEGEHAQAATLAHSTVEQEL